MVTTISTFIFLGVVFTCTAYTSAFWLNWGGAEPMPPQKQVIPQQGQWPVTAYYQQRVLQSPQYTVNEHGAPVPVQIPAIPIQVPLQAQLSPAASIQNVQLVPCLCPVAQDYEYDKVPDSAASSVFVSQIKPQQSQQQH